MSTSSSILPQFRALSEAFRAVQGDSASRYEPILDVLSKSLDAKVTVANLDGSALAQSGNASWNTAPQTTGRRGSATVLEQPIITTPIYAGRTEAGAVLVEREKREFTEAEQVLAEYTATLVGLVLHADAARLEAEETRRTATVRIALDALSYSEQAAAKRLFQSLDGPQGLVVTSHIADEMGITRSVIVNALRKLESAGVIETRSLGMKGTFIRVLNPLLPDAFEGLTL